MSSGHTHKRIESIEALRGLAALAVAWHHFTNGIGLIGDGWLKASGAYGYLGVEIFFVISGFIIPYSMIRGGYLFPTSIPTFLLKRLVRLEPPYLASILVAIALSYLSASTPWYRGNPPEINSVQLVSHIGYLTPILGCQWLNPVFWSLAIEFQYYLLVSVVYPLVASESRALRYASLGALCLSAIAIPAPLFVAKYLPLFALGIIAFCRAVGLESSRMSWVLTIMVAAAGSSDLGPAIMAVGIIRSLAITSMRFPKSRALVMLGAVSYSLYLLH